MDTSILRIFGGGPNAVNKKAAQARLKEAQRLLRRGKKTLDETDVQAVQQACAAVQQALSQKDAAAIADTSEALGTCVDKRLHHLRRPAWLESIESDVFAGLIALTIRCLFFEVFQIPSGSMIPTLAIGDKILVNKLVYGPRVPFMPVRLMSFAAPKRGEVVVFIAPMEPHEDYIKRIMAVAGDEIMVQDGAVFVNGTQVPHEPMAQSAFWDKDVSAEDWHQFTARSFKEAVGDRAFTVLQDVAYDSHMNDMPAVRIPEGHVFVMGDNRDHSSDSRRWGLVPTSNILGRAMFILYSWGKHGMDSGRSGLRIE